MDPPRFDNPINLAFGCLEKDRGDLRRSHFNEQAAFGAEAFKSLALAAKGDGFVEFDFYLSIGIHNYFLFCAGFDATICLNFQRKFGDSTSSPMGSKLVLDSFGQILDFFLTMDKGGENSGSIYEFGKFILDSRERILLGDGKPIHLTGKVFDTLLLLIEHNGRLLTKVEMMSALWEDSFVEESNLAKNISRLRKILNTDGVQLIETLPKLGYRFRADVRQIDGETSLLVHRSLRVRFLNSPNRSDDAKTFDGQPVLNEVQSLAVLPFEPLGANGDDDFFGLGITDALITQLGRAGQIRVRPTSSILKFNSSEQTAVSFGQELRVDAILEGRFQRYENKLRLTVQMLHTSGGDSLWAESFDAEVDDIFGLQDQIAERVIRALNRKLTVESQLRLKKRYTKNVEAYQEYLKGRYYWNKCTLIGYEKALERFQRAIDIDPLYALAYAGLAGVYNVLPLIDGFAPRDYFPKAKAAALRALEIDPQLAEAHTAFGLAILHYDWNWSGAEVAFNRAIEADPNYSNAYELLGVYLCRVERVSEAISALKRAGELDPLSPIHAVWLAEALRYCGETEASIRLHEDTLRSFPDFYPAHYHLSFSYLDGGRLDDAESHCEKAIGLSSENSLTLSLRGILQAARGNDAAARGTLTKLLKLKTARYISCANIASVYAALGDEEKTIEWLETAVAERDPNLTWIKFDREFGFLESNQRFQAILHEVGLAEKSAKLIESPRTTRSIVKPVILFGVLSVVIVSALGLYLWRRGEPRGKIETGTIRLTFDLKDDNHPVWLSDGRIRFLSTGSDRLTRSATMNSDGTGQTEVRDFGNLGYGVWSPDGSKIIFVKRGDRTAFYLASADGSNEIPLPFFGGNFDWSPDSKKIVYQKISNDNPEIFVYSLETGKYENVSNNPAFDADPDFSPDGKQIAFASLRDGNAEIYLMNVDGSNVRRLTNHPAWDSHPVFSPDGTQIAFPSNRDNESSDVYLMNADGGGIRRLTDWDADETVEPGCWSPDGTNIAFSSDRSGNDDIYVTSAEVFRPRLVLGDEKSNLQFPSLSSDGKQVVYQAETENKGGELRIFDFETKQSRVLLRTANTDLAPVLSPDGTRIAFQNKIGADTEICLINLDGSGLTNLTKNAARDAAPAFSPDGTQIVFASNRNGNYGTYDLYVMNSDGSNQRRIYTDDAGMSVSPAWSPDGASIIFANDKEDGATGNFEIFKIRFDQAGTAERLTFRRRSDGQPAVSPDGKRIVFFSDFDGNSEIYLMNSDGTGLLRLTRNLANDVTPRFSDDGTRVIFSSNRAGKSALYEIELAE